MSLKSDWPRGILFQSQLLYSKQEARENPCWYTYVFVYLVSEIVRGRREATERGQRVERGERDWEREERGEQEMAESGERLIKLEIGSSHFFGKIQNLENLAKCGNHLWNYLSNATEFARFRVCMSELYSLKVGAVGRESVRKFKGILVFSQIIPFERKLGFLRVKRRRRREEEEKKRRKRRSTSFRRGISSGVIPIKLLVVVDVVSCVVEVIVGCGT
uniref:Uncharacterized protein n=1 Tax=Solanum demissum TaxID=50514 RepID=Q6L3N1_SOLDE|nr:hypothetical protein SDM1_27t00002 [Solanum demissum]